MAEMKRRHASPMERQMTSAADRAELPEVDDLYLAYATGKASSKAETDKLRREFELLKTVGLAEVRNATLEEAAMVCEDFDVITLTGYYQYDNGQATLDGAADAIRAMKTSGEESA